VEIVDGNLLSRISHMANRIYYQTDTITIINDNILTTDLVDEEQDVSPRLPRFHCRVVGQVPCIAKARRAIVPEHPFR